jgi:hypothetical protein
MAVKRNAQVVRKDEADELDKVTWLTKTPEEKLSTLQLLREQYIRFLNKQSLYRASRKGLRRVCRVIKQA